MTDRREFLKRAGITGTALAVMSGLPSSVLAVPPVSRRDVDRFESGGNKELMMDALNAARAAGASFADARIGRFRQNFIVTREQQIINVVDTDTLGCGVRVLVDGCWGFAAPRTLTKDSVFGAARAAASRGRAGCQGASKASWGQTVSRRSMRAPRSAGVVP